MLDTGDASAFVTKLQGHRRAKEIALVAIANYAKFTGRYDQFQQLKKRYSLKWNECNSTRYFERFFNEQLSLESMLQRIKEMIRLVPTQVGNIIKFACVVGLRASECIESVRLLNSDNVNNHIIGNVANSRFRYYYNPERQALEHFRFPEIFIRQTKKAYISFITKEQLSGIGILDCKTPHPEQYNPSM